MLSGPPRVSIETDELQEIGSSATTIRQHYTFKRLQSKLQPKGLRHEQSGSGAQRSRVPAFRLNQPSKQAKRSAEAAGTKVRRVHARCLRSCVVSNMKQRWCCSRLRAERSNVSTDDERTSTILGQLGNGRCGTVSGMLVLFIPADDARSA